MKNKNIKIIIILAIIAFGGIWILKSITASNKTMEFRTIPDKSEILKAIETLASGNRDYKKYTATLKKLCDEKPVNKQIIIDNLILAKIYDQDSIKIDEDQVMANGDFTVTTYTISASNISPDQLDIILSIAQNISLATPKVNILNNNTLTAKITVTGLAFNKK